MNQPDRSAIENDRPMGRTGPSVTRRQLCGCMISGVGAFTVAGCLTETEESDPRGEYENASFLDSEPAYGAWLDQVEQYEGTVDLTGLPVVRVAVGAGGGLSFLPAAIAIDAGTAVIWEWTGRGGEHNVVETNQRFASDLVNEAGYRFSHGFDATGVYRYTCTPHDHLGMRGVVTVLE